MMKIEGVLPLGVTKLIARFLVYFEEKHACQVPSGRRHRRQKFFFWG